MKKRALCLNCKKYVKYNIEQAFDTIRTEKGNITYKRIIPKCRKCGEELYISKINEANLTRLDREYKKFNEDKVKYITDKDQEIARLTAENAALNARLEKAVILPYEIGKTVYWSIEAEEKSFIIQEGNIVSYSIDNTGIWIFCRYNSGLTYWHKLDDFIKNVDIDRAKAEARFAELKGGGESG